MPYCTVTAPKAAVVAVAIWLSFTMLLKELGIAVTRWVVIAEQFFSISSVYQNTPYIPKGKEILLDRRNIYIFEEIFIYLYT